VERKDPQTGASLGYDKLTCPSYGVTCTAQSITYDGGIWHDPAVAVPNCSSTEAGKLSICTGFYICSTNGCPERGATDMACKTGYNGPICAICDEGYFK
jgi:hypothetical protein